MIKAIFIAPSIREAQFWANLWGYKQHSHDWLYINCDQPDRIRGMRGSPDLPVYTCGSEGPGSGMWMELEMRGFTVYDAQSIEVPGNPEITQR